MAKHKKLPKRPKRSANVTTWENYHDRVKQVQKDNAQIDKDKKRKEMLIKKKVK